MKATVVKIAERQGLWVVPKSNQLPVETTVWHRYRPGRTYWIGNEKFLVISCRLTMAEAEKVAAARNRERLELAASIVSAMLAGIITSIILLRGGL